MLPSPAGLVSKDEKSFFNRYPMAEKTPDASDFIGIFLFSQAVPKFSQARLGIWICSNTPNAGDRFWDGRLFAAVHRSGQLMGLGISL